MDHLAKTIAITTHARMENCHVTAFSIDGNINTTDRMDTIIATSRLIPRERPYTMPITSGVAHPVTLCRSQDIV